MCSDDDNCLSKHIFRNFLNLFSFQSIIRTENSLTFCNNVQMVTNVYKRQ